MTKALLMKFDSAERNIWKLRLPPPVREKSGKQKIFKVRQKSGNFAGSQGKSFILSKSVKSQGILVLANISQDFVHKIL